MGNPSGFATASSISARMGRPVPVLPTETGVSPPQSGRSETSDLAMAR